MMEIPAPFPNRPLETQPVLTDPGLRELLALLADSGAAGLPAGVIADDLELPQSALTGLLSQLLSAGLVECEIRGDRVRYRTDSRWRERLSLRLEPEARVRRSALPCPLL